MTPADTFRRLTKLYSQPLLYGPSGHILPPAATAQEYQYTRQAAQSRGSMENWTPRAITSTAAAYERIKIVERSVDLCASSEAAGVIDGMATTVVGEGLKPHPVLDPDILGLDGEALIPIKNQMLAAYRSWNKVADITGHQTFGGIQHLCQLSEFVYGEYLVVPLMIRRRKPWNMALRVINPLRVKTPYDLWTRGDIIDGVEIDDQGQPSAYWVKKSGADISETSENFTRIPVKAGHRYRIIHGFRKTQPEQLRGIPILTPVMKKFRDLADFLDAELVSNVVTAAWAVFIETQAGTNPLLTAQDLSTITNTETKSDGTEYPQYLQELDPGTIFVGGQNDKPHLLSPNRPGATFEPFVATIKKSIASALGMADAVLFKDLNQLSFAGGRLAWLDAWRSFTLMRSRLANTLCQPITTMLMEEAWLKGRVDFPVDPATFYELMPEITRCDWRGSPKGNIEPIKDIQAEILANKEGLKSKTAIVAERGDDYRDIVEQLAAEKKMLKDAGLAEPPPSEDKQNAKPE